MPTGGADVVGVSTNDRPRTERALLETCVAALRAVLPPEWQISLDSPSSSSSDKPNVVVRLQSPDGKAVRFVVVARLSSTARAALGRLEQEQKVLAQNLGDARVMYATSFVSPWMQQKLEAADIDWIDATGNMRLRCSTPALFISKPGANRDPWPDDVPLRSLKGRGASVAVRALIDFQPPIGLLDLAKVANVAPATLSRVVNLLEEEDLIVRQSRGGIQSVNWAGIIQRWSMDVSYGAQDGRVKTLLAPRGIEAVISKLRDSQRTYAVTGSYAASLFTRVAPTRQLSLYVDEVGSALEELDLREAADVGNVRILTTYDPVVFERTTLMQGINVAALGQVAVDLMSGPGREPAEGEALLHWMEENANLWRTIP